jgi:hypothetical protein
VFNTTFLLARIRRELACIAEDLLKKPEAELILVIVESAKYVQSMLTIFLRRDLLLLQLYNKKTKPMMYPTGFV